ncbi:MAG: hypothetical protein U5R30_16475 [Deltaproteobacteria bacterium]|nr:hypothetical protein [Deltaproteobacteria bacterium]
MRFGGVNAALVLAVLALGQVARADGPATNSPPLRFGVSARTMVDLNRNDVTAALKVWMQTVARERGIPFADEPRIFDRTEDFVAALKMGEIDIASAPSDEFLILEQAAPLAGLYSTQVGGRITEEYVVLVKTDRPWQRLEDLRGTRLLVLAASPALIPGVGAYRTSVGADAAKKFREAALNLGETPAGRQLLIIFQADAFVEVTEADFAPTRAFLAAHARLMASSAGKGVAP